MDISYLLFSFQGRARRLHYWMCYLGSLVAFMVIFGIVASFGGFGTGHPNPIAGLLLLAFDALFIWVGLAISVKRAHDRDKSGWFLLVGLIPIVGGLWLLVELGILDGTPGPNKFGPSPKGLGAAAMA